MTLLTAPMADPNAPAVHALIIAVGNYPHLEGGGGDRFEHTGGMKQLDSPPVSALKFFEWMTKTLCPKGNKTIGSIEVLCSGNQQFLDGNQNALSPDDATMLNCQIAVNHWFTRGDRCEDNILIFYFCGHGVSSGNVHSLLLENFGDSPLDPFNRGAIDAEAFMDGMLRCKARSQLYLFDACRSIDGLSFDSFGSQRGVPLISAAVHAHLGSTQQACIWAATLGEQAYARNGHESLFMEALLLATKGAGSIQDSDDGEWVIQPGALKSAIDYLIERSHGKGVQVTTLDRLAKGFTIHVLQNEPVVPVKVLCLPLERMDSVNLSCSSGDYRVVGNNGPWHLDLSHNSYRFEAKVQSTGVVVSDTKHTHLPWTIVTLDI